MNTTQNEFGTGTVVGRAKLVRRSLVSRGASVRATARKLATSEQLDEAIEVLEDRVFAATSRLVDALVAQGMTVTDALALVAASE